MKKTPYDEVLEELRLHAASAVCTLEPRDCERIVKVLEERAKVPLEKVVTCEKCQSPISPIYPCAYCD